MILARTSRAIKRVAVPTAARSFSSQPASLPDMPYDYGALEPYINGQIMELHHKKHHQAYVNGYNAAREKELDAEAKGDIAAKIALQPAINFNGGGHVNHSIFWTNLAPPKEGGGGEPSGELSTLINKQWGSFENFKTSFSTQTAVIQGSGWGWLGYDKTNHKLVYQAMPNQDPLSKTGLVPLLGVDVWEHAYYLQYKNVRPDYLKEIWNVINWSNVAERLAAAKK